MHIPQLPSPTVKERDAGGALAITTTFNPPAQCTQGQLTMLGRQQFFVWLNEPVPVAGTTVSICYPSQFMTSYIDAMAGTTLPAFSPLVCPRNYQTILNQDLGRDAPYVVCCPNNYGFAPPASPDPNRPGAGGTCYSNILSTTVTKYNNDAYSGLIFFSTAGQAYAHPLDGFAFQGQHVATTSQAAAVPAPVPSSSAGVVQPSSVESSQTAAATNSPSNPPPSTSTPSTSQSAQSSNRLAQSLSTQISSAIAVSTAPSSLIPLSTMGTTVIYSTVQPSVVTIYSSVPDGTTQPSATTSSTAATQSPASTSAQTAGIAIGAILGVLLLVAALIFSLRRRRVRSTPAELSQNPSFVIEKPNLGDHPSTRSFPNEKQPYRVGQPTQLYEMSSPQDETHELGAGRDGYTLETLPKELDASPR